MYIKKGLYVCGLICATNVSIAENRTMTLLEKNMLKDIIELRNKMSVDDGPSPETVKKVTPEGLFNAGFYSEEEHILDAIRDDRNYGKDNAEERAFWSKTMTAVREKCNKNYGDEAFCMECYFIYGGIRKAVEVFKVVAAPPGKKIS